jgi:sulfonate transport system substrate-binding protein
MVGVTRRLAVGGLVATAASPALAQRVPLKLAGNTSTIELAPVLMVASRLGNTIENGGVPNLFRAPIVDLATNAETQALRESVANPDLRIIMTVSEGLYRLVGRRSSGIAKVADLKGKKIATIRSTSSAYFLNRLLATAGLSEADVTIVPLFPLNRMPPALVAREVDAVTIWEPEMDNCAEAIGEDAIEFSGKGVYRECFNLHARAPDLADKAKRAEIVAFVRQVVEASAQIRKDPKLAWPLVAASSKFPETLVAKTFKHHAYPGRLVPDLLDVITGEEVWLAAATSRPARPRQELARLIDPSVLREAGG